MPNCDRFRCHFALYIPHIFSYLNEDIDFVLNELKAKGLCRDFLAQQKDRGDRTHV
ncbi:derepression protein [Salmonella enterica]|nr:derepression protein [Salmonella enterica]